MKLNGKDDGNSRKKRTRHQHASEDDSVVSFHGGSG